MNEAPITKYHTCGACGCHVPVDAYIDVLQAKYNRILTQLRETREALKDCRRQK